jgi:hypothetical protein
LVLPAVLAAWAENRRKVFGLGFVAVHLHLLCDFVGSRGPTLDDIWPLWYFAPFSDRPVWSWEGQWPLNAWPNVLFTVLLLAYALWAAAARGHSPVELFSTKVDSRVVIAVRKRWQSLRRGV